jgi:3-hydroxybutyrate dehydrogenase
MRLKDKVALITGATSGIGKEIAKTFSQEGAKIGVASRELGRAIKVAEEINQTGGEAFGIEMDVSDEDQVKTGVRSVIGRFGHINILVASAGIQHISSVNDLNYGKWKEVIDVNLGGAFLTTRACLKEMLVSGGTIIYIGSVHSVEASPLKAPYVAAKHGLIGLAKVVAKEGALHDIRTNVICPGFVRTPLVEKQIPIQSKQLGMSEDDIIEQVMLGNTVDGKFTTLQDVAQTAVFLAAFPSNALTGESIMVAHGWGLR